MRGVICKRHVLAHPVITIQSFGWQVFFRAITAGRDRTFLSIVAPTLHQTTTPASVSSFIERCVALEVRAGEVYRRLAQRFEDVPPLARFFDTLATQEMGHAELLEFCRGLASGSCWREEEVAEWRDSIPGLEKRMAEVEDGLDQLTDPAATLRLVIEIEGSEINHVFRGVVAATDNEFVRTFQAFQDAEKEHLEFLCREIPRMEANLTDACAELRALHH
jgi:rubrerythrin